MLCFFSIFPPFSLLFGLIACSICSFRRLVGVSYFILYFGWGWDRIGRAGSTRGGIRYIGSFFLFLLFVPLRVHFLFKTEEGRSL